MDIRKLQRAIVDGLEDVKAQHIAVFNTEHLSPLFERVIIASGTSNRQTKALAASVRDTVKSRGLQVLRTEGEDNGEWIIVDCGAAVAHIMQPTIREYYHLEEIWGGKTVKMKAGEVKVARSAAPSGRASAKKVAVKAAPAKTTAAKKAPAKKAAAKSPVAKAAPAKTAPAKKWVTPKPVAKKVATQSVAAKRPAAKKPAAKTVAKTPAKRGA